MRVSFFFLSIWLTAGRLVRNSVEGLEAERDAEAGGTEGRVCTDYCIQCEDLTTFWFNREGIEGAVPGTLGMYTSFGLPIGMMATRFLNGNASDVLTGLAATAAATPAVAGVLGFYNCLGTTTRSSGGQLLPEQEREKWNDQWKELEEQWKDQTKSSLPEHWKDPLTGAVMRDPVSISTGYTLNLDRKGSYILDMGSLATDAKGNFFNPVTRKFEEQSEIWQELELKEEINAFGSEHGINTRLYHAELRDLGGDCSTIAGTSPTATFTQTMSWTQFLTGQCNTRLTGAALRCAGHRDMCGPGGVRGWTKAATAQECSAENGKQAQLLCDRPGGSRKKRARDLTDSDEPEGRRRKLN